MKFVYLYYIFVLHLQSTINSMKNKIVISIIATVAIFMPFSIVFGQTETIDNKTIISLVKRNLDEDIIISKINTTACVFDVSPESLINLNSIQNNFEITSPNFDVPL